MQREDDVVARLLAARAQVKTQQPPAWHYDEQHDIFTYILRKGAYEAIVVDNFFTVFQNEKEELLGVQLTNLKKIKDCLGLKALTVAHTKEMSMVNIVLNTFDIKHDGVGDGEHRAITYIKAMKQLQNAPSIPLAELAWTS